MPYYDYQCKACGHQREVFHRLNEEGPQQCPECGKRQVEQVIAGKTTAVHIFYSPMHPRHGRGRGH